MGLCGPLHSPSNPTLLPACLRATCSQTAVAAKTNTNDVSLLRLVNKFVRQVHGGRVTSCKVRVVRQLPRAAHLCPCAYMRL